MKDRFDLETDISQLHNFAEQLSLISQGILEHNLSTDDTVNAIEGLRVMINLQASKMQDTMCQCFKLDTYRDEVAY